MSVDITDYRLALIVIVAIAMIATIETIKLVKNKPVKIVIVLSIGIFILGPSISCFFKSLGGSAEVSIFLSSLIWLMVVIALLISVSAEKPKNKSEETKVESKGFKEKTEIFAKELLEKCKDINVVGVRTDIENKRVIIYVENIAYGEGFLQENREIIEGLIKKHYGLSWRFEIEEFECQVFTK